MKRVLSPQSVDRIEPHADLQAANRRRSRRSRRMSRCARTWHGPARRTSARWPTLRWCEAGAARVEMHHDQEAHAVVGRDRLAQADQCLDASRWRRQRRKHRSGANRPGATRCVRGRTGQSKPRSPSRSMSPPARSPETAASRKAQDDSTLAAGAFAARLRVGAASSGNRCAARPVAKRGSGDQPHVAGLRSRHWFRQNFRFQSCWGHMAEDGTRAEAVAV
jgi:hypothetical protein